MTGLEFLPLFLTGGIQSENSCTYLLSVLHSFPCVFFPLFSFPSPPFLLLFSKHFNRTSSEWCMDAYALLEEQGKGLLVMIKESELTRKKMNNYGNQGLFWSWKLSLLVWYLAVFKYTKFLPSSHSGSVILLEKVLVEPEAVGWTAKADDELFSRSGAWRRWLSAAIWSDLELLP